MTAEQKQLAATLIQLGMQQAGPLTQTPAACEELMRNALAILDALRKPESKRGGNNA